MDFELNEDQRILQKSARDFLKKECPKELVRSLNDHDGHSADLWRKMADLGWMGLLLPEEYDGAGWSFVELAVLMEEMGYNICPSPYIATTILGGQTILLAGSEEQKRKYLPRTACGDLILTMAITEFDGGFEPAAFNMPAVRKGDEWVLSGVKLFVPYALGSAYMLCVARTSEASDPASGLTIFMVRTDNPEVKVTPLRTISKDKQCEVAFHNVRLTPDSVVGEVDQAWPMVEAVLQRAAVARSAETVGAVRAVLDMTVAYAKERVQFGRPIGSFQAIQHYLADTWVDLLGTRNLVMKAAWKLATGQPAEKEVAMAKARTGEIGRKATSTGHRIFGAIGFTMEHDLHLYHRGTVAGDLAFGNSDLYYDQVASGLGL